MRFTTPRSSRQGDPRAIDDLDPGYRARGRAPRAAGYRAAISCPGPSRHIAPPRDLGRFSNRPFEVKHFQTIRHCNVDVAHGLALLFGIGTRALPSWDPRTRWNNLTGGLALPLAGPSDRADSPHPLSREGH